MATVFLDVQGFKAPPRNRFVLKEVAISFLRGEKSSLKHKHFLVKLDHEEFCWSDLPSKYKKINSYLVNNHHGIDWQQGVVTLSHVIEIMRNIDLAYVKGEEKVRWCKKLFPFIQKIVNVEEEFNFKQKITSFPNLNHCHQHQGVCSLNTVCVLRQALTQPKIVKLNIESPQVKIIRVWDFASRSARKSVWQQVACDREKFQRRIQEAAKFIEPVLARIRSCYSQNGYHHVTS